MRPSTCVLLSALCLACIGGCSGSSSSLTSAGEGGSPVVDGSGGPDGGGTPDGASEASAEGGGLLSIDCTATNPNCPALTMPPDMPDDAHATGFADPSMRRDPATGTLWMSYSYLDTFTVGSVSTRVIELHLASSLDDGKTWTYAGSPLFTHEQVTTQADGAGPGAGPYYTSHEVSNLYPVEIGGSVTWVMIYKYYTVVSGGSPVAGADGGVDFTDFTASSMLVLASGGATPEGLGSAPSVRLGAAGTKNTVDVDLSALSSDVAGCAQLDEPALMTTGDGKLYLAAFCLPLTAGGSVDYPNGKYVVFSTTPATGDPTSWTWAYEGTLAGPQQASLLGSCWQYWWQLDLAKRQDGTLLAVVSPAKTGTVGGCQVAEIASLSPPSIGNYVELASITTSDNVSGDACTYEPTSSTGVVIFRGPYAVTDGKVATLNATGLSP
jgi:hypothetical protein